MASARVRAVLRAAAAASAGAASSSGLLLLRARADDVVSSDDAYVGRIKVYGVGILEDPIKGTKRGKGTQALNSSYWIEDLSCFIARHLPVLKAMLRRARRISEDKEGLDYQLLTNQANIMFMRAENGGLGTDRSLENWLMASWLAMAAAEVDTFAYSKYTRDERLKLRDRFYSMYEAAEPDPAGEDLPADLTGDFTMRPARVDLLPQVALERLGLHNELCELKYPDSADEWKRQGFKLSRRISSTKRHFDGVHRRDTSEDHIAHLLWNLMAVYHVSKVFPDLNDLTDFEALHRQAAAAASS